MATATSQIIEVIEVIEMIDSMERIFDTWIAAAACFVLHPTAIMWKADGKWHVAWTLKEDKQ